MRDLNAASIKFNWILQSSSILHFLDFSWDHILHLFFCRYDDDIATSRQNNGHFGRQPQYQVGHQAPQYSPTKPLQRAREQQKKMPTDWRLQLLQHIERKRIEKGSDPRMDSVGLHRNHTATDIWKMRSPEIPVKNHHRAVTAPSSLPVESLYSNIDSARTVESSSGGGSRLPARRSSGRYLRARTPGPEMGSSLTSTPTEAVHRPKSAMGNLYTSPPVAPTTPNEAPAPVTSPQVHKKKKKAPPPPSVPPHRVTKVSVCVHIFVVIIWHGYRVVALLLCPLLGQEQDDPIMLGIYSFVDFL